MTQKIFGIILLVLIIGAFFGGIKYSTSNNVVDTNNIDNILVRIDTIYLKTTDTIKILKYKKELVDANFTKDTENLSKIKNDTNKLKKQFDSVYIKSINDSNTNVGYSQIYGALLINDKYTRNYTKLLLTDTQLTVCEAGLDSLHINGIRLADTAKKDIVVQYNKGYSDAKLNTFKVTITTFIISILLGFGIGEYLIH